MSIRIYMVRAGAGDAFVVSVQSTPKPWLGVIDGGPPGTPLTGVIKKAISETPCQAEAVNLMAVTHVDDDHIGGILDLVRYLGAKDPAFDVEFAWHNSFQALTGSTSGASDTVERERRVWFLAADHGHEATLAPSSVVASISQGAELRDLLAALGLGGNPPFTDLPFGGLLLTGQKILEDPWPAIHILGPSIKQIAALRAKWNKKETVQLRALTAAANKAAPRDQSVTNRSSLVFLLSHGGKRILFTGDARGDEIVDALRTQGLLDKNGQIHVNALKVPHHGSPKSCLPELFTTVIADHYLISGNGRHGNPSLETAKNLSAGLDGRAATVWMTYARPEFSDHFSQVDEITVLVPPKGDKGTYLAIDI